MNSRRVTALLFAICCLPHAVPADEPRPSFAGQGGEEESASGTAGDVVSRFVLDPRQTEIRFTLDAVAHTVRGTAELVEGEVAFGELPGPVSGRIVVDARSLETGNRKRDRDMHRKVLESETHPEIVFVPARAEAAPSDVVGVSHVLHGTMEIHGGAHEVSMWASVDRAAEGLDVRLRFDVPYVAWGMEDPSFFLFRVGKRVTIEIEATLLPAPPADAAEN